MNLLDQLTMVVTGVVTGTAIFFIEKLFDRRAARRAERLAATGGLRTLVAELRTHHVLTDRGGHFDPAVIKGRLHDLMRLTDEACSAMHAGSAAELRRLADAYAYGAYQHASHDSAQDAIRRAEAILQFSQR